MFKNYQMTILEEFVEELFEEHGIIEPRQLTIQELSSRLNVWVYFEEVTSRAFEAAPGMYSMFLNSRIPKSQQRLDFFHELCHLLRHAGNQVILPESFTRMQEIEAERFVLYATMPFTMISQLKLPDRRNSAIHSLAENFNVPFDLAEQRLDQIQRRSLQGSLNVMIRDFDQKQHCINPSWSYETQRILKQLDRQLIAKGLTGYRDKGLL